MQDRNRKDKPDCKRRMKRPSALAKKIGDIISIACGSRRKAQQMCIHNSEKPKECMEQKKSILGEHRQFALTKSRSSRGNQVSKVCVSGSRRKGGARKSKKQSSKAAKRRLTVLSSLSGILRSTGFSLRKWKTIKSGYTNGSKGSGLKPIYGTIKKAKLRLKREASQGEKKKKKHEEKECEAKEDNGELELCKRRILMGEKCRPLNLSGALHYDKEGILLPEDIDSAVA